MIKTGLEMTQQKEKDTLFTSGQPPRMTENVITWRRLGVERLNYLTKCLLSKVKESRARIDNEIEIWKNSDSHGPIL